MVANSSQGSECITIEIVRNFLKHLFEIRTFTYLFKYVKRMSKTEENIKSNLIVRAYGKQEKNESLIDVPERKKKKNGIFKCYNITV